ncbi:phosphate ABC transporter substrate-binding protein [Ligilactobacillus salitolerans]|uniref:Phosphate-binding protein n=1 Tax=Ligilactobacillus salitolerans TaxID=1808352 RepID=A0A401IUF6_9LACO|nr:phosphate ABC transporter substrate-binding protein [Ligilactobacillus salitolerans]GBG95128.1 phosphate ABC transporter substrate-binding protein [Ligilactobacillus salitolerans]
MKKKQIITTLLVLGLALAGCAKQDSSAKKTIQVVGSSAMQPIVEMGAHEYQRSVPEQKITVQGGGSGTGLSQVQSGAVDIGNSDIFAANQKGIAASKLHDHKLAVIGVAPIVNKDVGVKNITMAQLRGIYTGHYTNWKQLGGQNIEIVVIDRAQGSGTRSIFDSEVLGGQKKMKAQEQDSNGSVQHMVADTPGAISYVSFPYLKDTFTALKIDGIAPTTKNVTTNAWKLWGYEHMYTGKSPSKETKAFINYLLKSDKIQEKLLTRLHYISLRSMKVEKDQHGKVTPVE